MADFVLASCSVPVNYDYTRLNVETRVLDEGGERTMKILEVIVDLPLFLRTPITVYAVSGTVDY